MNSSVPAPVWIWRQNCVEYYVEHIMQAEIQWAHAVPAPVWIWRQNYEEYYVEHITQAELHRVQLPRQIMT